MSAGVAVLCSAEAIVEQLQASSAPLAVAQLRVLGGAMARVSADATAFAHRRRRIMAAIGAVWGRGEEAATHKVWVRGVRTLAPSTNFKM